MFNGKINHIYILYINYKLPFSIAILTSLAGLGLFFVSQARPEVPNHGDHMDQIYHVYPSEIGVNCEPQLKSRFSEHWGTTKKPSGNHLRMFP
jgi:hypothetical protein